MLLIIWNIGEKSLWMVYWCTIAGPTAICKVGCHMQALRNNAQMVGGESWNRWLVLLIDSRQLPWKVFRTCLNDWFSWMTSSSLFGTQDLSSLNLACHFWMVCLSLAALKICRGTMYCQGYYYRYYYFTRIESCIEQVSATIIKPLNTYSC